MRTRVAVVAACIAVCAPCAQIGASMPARASTLQLIAGARVSAVADKIARTLVTGPDRSIASAYTVLDQRVPAGTVDVVPAGTPYVSPTYVGVPIAIRVDGAIARTVVAGYRVTTYVQTTVAARDLVPGTVLAESDLVTARVAWNGRPAVGADVLIGRRITAAAVKGTPLYVEATVPDSVVKPGQAAILIIHDGDVSLTADVIARTGGAVGDTVTVISPQTQKAIAAVVTGPNRVELTLPGGTDR